MNKEITLKRIAWLTTLYFIIYLYIYIYIYIFLILKSFFKPSFRPSGPGSAAGFKRVQFFDGIGRTG